VTIPAYLINLDRDTERLAGMEKRLGALRLAFRRFRAYRGRNIPERWRHEFGDTHNGVMAQGRRSRLLRQ